MIRDEPPLCVHAGIVELCSPHTLVVNRAGLRFADETFFQGIVPDLRRFDAMRRDYPNVPSFLIFDQQYLRQYSFANRPAGSAVAEGRAARRHSAGPRRSARDRCRRPRRDRRAFQRLCPCRRRCRFPSRREPMEARRRQIRRPAMRASARSRSRPSTASSCIRPMPIPRAFSPTDAARVMHQRRRPIPGLYASGYVAAQTESGIGYQCGLLLASSMTFCYLAVLDMLNERHRPA